MGAIQPCRVCNKSRPMMTQPIDCGQSETEDNRPSKSGSSMLNNCNIATCGTITLTLPPPRSHLFMLLVNVSRRYPTNAIIFTYLILLAIKHSISRTLPSRLMSEWNGHGEAVVLKVQDGVGADIF